MRVLLAVALTLTGAVATATPAHAPTAPAVRVHHLVIVDHLLPAPRR